MRNFIEHVKLMRQQEGKDDPIEDEKALRFQKWYMTGQMPDGSAVFEEHQKSLGLQPFTSLRDLTQGE